MTTLIHKAKPIRGPLQVAERASATLLVVDDSVFQHHVITGLLKAEDDLRIIFAKCGEEALAVLEREAPNLILTDLIMPDSDGLELVQQVRDRFPALPMILMTAYGSEEVAMRALRAGATNYVPKTLPATVRRPCGRFCACRPSTGSVSSSCGAWPGANRHSSLIMIPTLLVP